MCSVMESHCLTFLQLKHYNRQAHPWVFNAIDIFIPKILFYLHNIYSNTKLSINMTDNWDCHSYFTNKHKISVFPYEPMCISGG